MTQHTPEQIADKRLVQNGATWTLHLGDKTVYNISDEHAETIRLAMIAAVETDRFANEAGFENPLARATHEALEDRGSDAAVRAAAWVRENEGDLFWSHAGPFLDELEEQEGAER